MLRRLFLALLLIAAAPAWAAGDSGWFYRNSDIAPDPAWTFGTLPNGLRYAVRRNSVPEGQVSVRLRIDAGSLHEEDGERGWAHFIEHMAFRGTKNFGDGEARETWQRLGASFGSDTNASTEPTQTVYMLDLPHADQASLDTSLRLLADMADTALFDPRIVDMERGVVLSEYGRRTELAVKLRETMMPLFFGGLKYAERDTIGTEATLKGATAAGLRTFYERWYRPDRATVVMVGDADPKLMERLIADRFGGWKASGPAPKEPDYGTPSDVAQRAAAIAYPGSPHFATLSWIRPYSPAPPTKARERRDLARTLARRILNRRLEAKARGESAFLNAQVQADNDVNVADYTQMSVMAKEGRWQEALKEAYAILADALGAPPSRTEIDREMENIRTAGRAALQGDPTQRSQVRAGRLVSALDGNSVISTAEVQLALFEELAPAMTPEAVQSAMKAMFAGSGPRIAMLSPAPVTGLEQALAAAEAAAPAKRQAERRVSLDDLPPLGPPGREVSRQRIADLDSTIVRFANGSSLVFKQTGYEKGSVNVALRFGRGMAALPADRKSPAWMASLLGSTGVGPLDLDGLERLMTGRRMSMSFDLDDDALILRGSTRAEELGDQLRLLATKIVAPHFDPALFQRSKVAALESYDLAFASASSRLGREFGAVARGGDPRWQPFDRAEIERLSHEDFQAFMTPLLAAGPVEAVIVGDVDLESAVAAMLRTVAALPPRPEVRPPARSLEVRPPRASKEPIRFTHQGDPNQAYAALGWTTFGGHEARRERRALGVAANLAQARLIERLRDSEGASYSPAATVQSSFQFREWGFFFAGSEVRPERADLFFRLAREIVADLARTPPSADEWQRAINPVVSGIERRLRTNAYWAGAMADWSREPRLIEYARTYLADYRSLTPEEVRAAVAKWVTDEGDWSILVLPAKAGGGVH
ncbi:MAG TPA: insulinase family protein [Allosphingosinicella sp.]|jgi:zinc protease|nr:insulinase family protein [Allosphingosinicella sp.]